MFQRILDLPWGFIVFKRSTAAFFNLEKPWGSLPSKNIVISISLSILFNISSLVLLKVNLLSSVKSIFPSLFRKCDCVTTMKIKVEILQRSEEHTSELQSRENLV